MTHLKRPIKPPTTVFNLELNLMSLNGTDLQYSLPALVLAQVGWHWTSFKGIHCS